MFEEYFVMRILSLVLVGYNRLKLRGVKRVELQVVENHVLIVGTNGCGKSSLLEELSPLPANHQEYSKDGSKVIVVETNGTAYRLTSLFSPQNKHSFCKILPEGEIELNPSGLSSIQKQLVKEIFNYDEQIHAVMVGKDRFTDMSKEERQDWVMRLSGIDLTYGLSIFQKIKTQHRDTVGSVKYLTKQIAEVSAKKQTIENILKLETECEELHSAILNLMAMKDTSIGFTADVKEQQRKLQERMILQTKQFNGLYEKHHEIRLVVSQVNSLDDAKKQQYHLQQKLEELDKGIEERYKVLEQNDALMQTLSYFGLEDKQQLLDTKQRVESEMNALWDTFTDSSITFCLQEKIQPLLDVYSAIHEELTEIFMQMEERYTNEEHQKTLKQREELNSEISKINQRIGILQHQVNHFNNAELTECPKCTHKWVKGFNEVTIKDTIKLVDELESRKLSYLEKLEALAVIIEKQLQFFTLVKRLSGLKKNFSNATLIWETIQPFWESANFKTIPSALCRLVTNLQTRAKIYTLEAELRLLDSAVRQISNEKEVKVREVKHQWDRIHEEIVIDTERSIRLKQYVKNLTKLVEYEEQMVSLSSSNAKLLEESKQVFEQEVRNSQQFFLNQSIRRIQSDLAKKEEELNFAKNIEKTISSLEQSKNNAEEEAECLKILMDELSPASGLLAEELSNFIVSFAEQLTRIINSVWTYPMRVIPCTNDKGVLDYRFPLDVNDGSNKSGDVKKTSLSQLAIVNLAFKLVVMFYLEMDSYPLLLDEVSPNLDEQHRINITAFIKQFVESKRCGQMFMVSHDANEAGSFYPHQFCIMDKTNIVQMAEYQNHKHFKIV